MYYYIDSEEEFISILKQEILKWHNEYRYISCSDENIYIYFWKYLKKDYLEYINLYKERGRYKLYIHAARIGNTWTCYIIRQYNSYFDILKEELIKHDKLKEDLAESNKLIQSIVSKL